MGDNLEFVLCDVQGKILTKIGLDSGKHKTNIESTNLQSGVYIYKILSDSYKLFNGRVVIIK